MHIFVNDFVKFKHPDFDDTLGKVLKIFTKASVKFSCNFSSSHFCIQYGFYLIQEGSIQLCIRVTVLLSLNQVWEINPQLSVLYPDEETYVIFCDYDIPLTTVQKLVNPPLKIVRVHGNQLLSLTYQVFLHK